MTTFTPEQFIKHLQEQQKKVAKLIENDLPVHIGKIATEHFKENFQNEAFDKEKWDEVQRRKPDTRAYKYTKGAKRSRKILTGDTGNLGRSIQHRTEPGKVIVHSDLEYASAHNEGTSNAGRNNSVTIPKRQFIGDSEELDKKIEDKIVKEINKIFK